MNELYTLRVSFSLGTCTDVRDIHLDTTLFDPSDRPVAFDAGLSGDDFPFATFTLRFTPAQAGPYHLIERFEPNIRTFQSDVQVADDRRDGGRWADVDQPCLLLDRQEDTLICASLPDAGVHLIRDGGTVQTVDGDTFAHAGEWVWVLRGSMVTPYRFDGGAMAAAAPPIDFHLTAPRWLDAQGNQALVMGTQQFNQVTLEADAGITVGPAILWPATVLFPKVHWVPNQVVDVQGAMTGLPSAGCPVSLSAPPSGSCFTPGFVTIGRGANADGVWSTVVDAGDDFAVDGTLPSGMAYESSLHLGADTFGVDELAEFSTESLSYLEAPDASFLPHFDGTAIGFQAFPSGFPHPQGNLIWYVESGVDAGPSRSAQLPGRVRWFDR